MTSADAARAVADEAARRAANDDAVALVTESASVLAEIYDPAGVLISWSSRIRYLGERRPCDLYRDRDCDGLRLLNQRLNAPPAERDERQSDPPVSPIARAVVYALLGSAGFVAWLVLIAFVYARATT